MTPILAIFRRRFDWAARDWLHFFRAGGGLRPSDWLRVTPKSRGAAIRAWRAHRAETIALFARANHGIDGMAEVYSAADNGRLSRRIMLEETASEMVRDMSDTEVQA